MSFKVTGPRRSAFVAYVSHFFTLIAHDDWDDAFRLLDRPGSHGTTWTRSLIQNVIHETFSPTSRFALDPPEPLTFTDPQLLPLPPPSWLRVGAIREGYEVLYPVPLNGDWTVLTAIVEFHRQGSQRYEVVLDDLHVL